MELLTIALTEMLGGVSKSYHKWTRFFPIIKTIKRNRESLQIVFIDKSGSTEGTNGGKLERVSQQKETH